MEEKWIHDGITEDAIKWADTFGENLSKQEGKFEQRPLTTSQLRKFFGELKRIDTNRQKRLGDVLLLKPMLAYAVGRDKNAEGKTKTKIDLFEREVSKGLSAIRKDSNGNYLESDFKNFVKLIEAVVAYHKYHGGEKV